MGSRSRRLNQSTHSRFANSTAWPHGDGSLGFVQTVNCFGEGNIVRISDTADRRFDTAFSQGLGIID